ncbi:MAG: hypothetical protein JNJ61_07605 [Anaerolineae bacterium]|nr:hypothetical protein [Anaerolineae bacterium]
MKFVEEHERMWGTEAYKGRPSLKQLLEARVVVFWHPTSEDMYPTATIHKNLEEINEYVTHLVWHTTRTRLPVLRLQAIFVDKTSVRIKGVKVEYERAKS